MSRKRATTRVIRFIGGPADGLTIPWVEGYFREGDTECVEGDDLRDGSSIPNAVYVMHGGNLHYLPDVAPTPMPEWMRGHSA